MTQKQQLKIGISIGDLNGIGAEVVLKTFEDERILEFCTPVIFANSKVLSFIKKHLNIDLQFQGISDLNKIIDGKVNVYNVWKENVNINFGTPDTKVGNYALKSLEAATEALKNKQVDILVTAPINKNRLPCQRITRR